MSGEKLIGTIRVGEEPFFEVVDKGDAHLEIRFVYERSHGLRIPKKLVNSLTEILKSYDGRRRHSRYVFSEDVLLESGDDRIRILCRTTNISQSGVFVGSLAVLPRGTEIQLKIPARKPQVHASVLVRNVREGVGMGLEFATVRPKSRDKLAKLLARCSEHVVG
ncbi:MAG: PilZ domain-containing protein [Candidatus Acidoferrales bacterium]